MITPSLRTGGRLLTRTDEIIWLTDLESALSSLVARCNAFNGTSLVAPNLVTPQDVCAPLSVAQHDANVLAVQSILNALLAAAAAQGAGGATVSLYTVAGVGGPLHAWHHDMNCKAVAAVANALKNLFDIKGL